MFALREQTSSQYHPPSEFELYHTQPKISLVRTLLKISLRILQNSDSAGDYTVATFTRRDDGFQTMGLKFHSVGIQGAGFGHLAERCR